MRHGNLVAVLEIATDARQVDPHRDSDRAQMRFRADTGEHEQLRCIEGAARENDFSTYLPRRTPVAELKRAAA